MVPRSYTIPASVQDNILPAVAEPGTGMIFVRAIAGPTGILLVQRLLVSIRL